MSYRYILMGKFNNKIEKHLELSEIADILKEYKEKFKKKHLNFVVPLQLPCLPNLF